jgi:acetyltransferase-like isoleucine patch superfamily enzyme
MKTGIGISKKIRTLSSYYNLFRFWLRKIFIGFDYAQQLIRNIDKNSVQLILKKNGASIGDDCDIETGLTFHNCKNFNNLIIGNSCHIGKNCFFDLKNRITIDDNVVISMQTTIITHQDMSKSAISNLYPAKSKAVLIKKNTYIGTNSVILMGITLSEGSFVAAGSVVTKDVPPYTMVGGVPAKIIKNLPKSDTKC